METPLAVGPVTLTGQSARHVGKVLRRQAGDPLTLFDGAGQSGQATIQRIHRDSVEVVLHTLGPDDRESPLEVRLAIAMARGDAMDHVIQKATELGATTLQPLLTERSVVRLPTSRTAKRMAHWQRLAASACEQCGRNTLPRIEAPCSLHDWLGALGTTATGEVRLLANPSALGGAGLPAGPFARTSLLVGPEGGLSDSETGLAESVGFASISLGPRILRTETAAVCLLSLVQWQLGDLNSSQTTITDA